VTAITRIDVPVRGGSLAAFRFGAPDPDATLVLAAHGITANSRSWLPVARALDGRAQLIAPDLRGRGESRSLPEPFGMAAHAADLVAVLDHVGAERAVLAGHSMGAYVAARVGADHPNRLEAAVLVDGGLVLPGYHARAGRPRGGGRRCGARARRSLARAVSARRPPILVRQKSNIAMRTLSHPTPAELSLAHVLHALSDPIRLEIVRALDDGEELPCSRLDAPVSKSTLSHHLKVLRDAGITRTRADGTQRLVSLRAADLESRFPGLLDCILEDLRRAA
jgi:pimeloyl-ACP methyl ester carboxylesterase